MLINVTIPRYFSMESFSINDDSLFNDILVKEGDFECCVH